MAKDKQINLRLDDEDCLSLKRIAERERRSEQEVLRDRFVITRKTLMSRKHSCDPSKEVGAKSRPVWGRSSKMTMTSLTQ